VIRKKCLGIHYDEKIITSVLLEQTEGDFHFESLTPTPPKPQTENANEPSLIQQFARRVDEYRSKTLSVALALGGRYYQSQLHHSELTDDAQLKQTLRYDVEEDFSTNAESMVICFQKKPDVTSGSDLIVHTADRTKLQELLDHFDTTGLDALIVEPDVVSWWHFLCNFADLPANQSVIAVGWTSDLFYMLILDERHRPILSRSYPCSCADEALDLLQCELNRSLAQIQPQPQISCLLYHREGFDEKQVAQAAKQLQLIAQPLAEPSITTAFAVGVALGWCKGTDVADFRSDEMAPRTVTVARRQALYGLSAAVTIFMLALVWIFNSRAANYRNLSRQAQTDMVTTWKEVFSHRSPLRQTAQIPTDVKRQLDLFQQKIRGRSGPTASDSASYMLMRIFNALKYLPREFDLVIDSLAVNAKTASTFRGSVATMEDLEKLRNVLLEADEPLEIENSNFNLTGSGSRDDPSSRWAFNLTLQPGKKTADKPRVKND